MQAAARGLTQGFGLSLGAILGGAIYSSLGARTCFAVSAALPSASFLLLVIPPWIKSGGGKWEELAVETELDHWESIQSQRVCQRECRQLHGMFRLNCSEIYFSTFVVLRSAAAGSSR